METPVLERERTMHTDIQFSLDNIATDSKVPDKETLERIAFMSFIIPEFGEAYKMEKRRAYLYLKEYGGIDYIYRHWWALHTDNPRHALRDIFDICKKNGGYL
ncbi:hypothetical protein R80B4_02724 [Fibrobacteres bacterium R8-0-B4]